MKKSETKIEKRVLGFRRFARAESSICGEHGHFTSWRRGFWLFAHSTLHRTRIFTEFWINLQSIHHDCNRNDAGKGPMPARPDLRKTEIVARPARNGQALFLEIPKSTLYFSKTTHYVTRENIETELWTTKKP